MQNFDNLEKEEANVSLIRRWCGKWLLKVVIFREKSFLGRGIANFTAFVLIFAVPCLVAIISDWLKDNDFRLEALLFFATGMSILPIAVLIFLLYSMNCMWNMPEYKERKKT
ncbi:MAG: hypothetical protein U5L10_03625 [Candidatus Moranbacteria bacterium]|nr:hypothetical protein [Candidatus Moranbacteria bacterium]